MSDIIDTAPAETDAAEPAATLPQVSEPDVDETDVDADDGTDPAAKARNEAKRYRLRLREAEEALTVATDALETYRRRDAEQVAGQVLADGGDLWVAGTDLVDVMAEDGTVDPAKVLEAAQMIAETRPHWKAQARPMPDADQGARPPSPPAPASFAETIKRATGR